MLSEFYNENEQAEILQTKTLSFRVSCKAALTDKLSAALHFVMYKMGLIMLEDFTFIDGQNHYTLLTSNGNKLHLELKITEVGPNTEYIIFHTDDCLRDYHKYIMLGVEFINRPEYNNYGLQVKFIDDQDNYYTLLEERTYTES